MNTQRRTLMAAALAGGVARVARAAARPVVLELFTSQGCSSCPPADALLGVLSRRGGVIGLAWHVDYWDGLGWRDRYASRLATQRQRAYARRLNDDVYTPALVVDGRRMVVGSDSGAVNVAMAASDGPQVAIDIVSGNAGRQARIAAAAGPVSALFAVYDPEVATDVAGGENRGERLREYRVVREAMALASWDGGPRQIALPDVPRGRGAVVLLQSADLSVLGAVDLPPG
jgi:hypothetical protein